MSEEPMFRIVRGAPTPDELAAIVGVLWSRRQAAAAAAAANSAPATAPVALARECGAPPRPPPATRPRCLVLDALKPPASARRPAAAYDDRRPGTAARIDSRRDRSTARSRLGQSGSAKASRRRRHRL